MKQDIVKKMKKPKQVFIRCPDCDSEELISCGTDVLCCRCDWDSCEATVLSGEMDNLFRAYLNLYRPEAQVATSQQTEGADSKKPNSMEVLENDKRHFQPKVS